jgi:hypothetical protein
LKEGEKGKNFDKKVNSLTGTKLVAIVVLFLFVHFVFFGNTIPSSAQAAGLRFAQKKKLYPKLPHNHPLPLWTNNSLFSREGGKSELLG